MDDMSGRISDTPVSTDLETKTCNDELESQRNKPPEVVYFYMIPQGQQESQRIQEQTHLQNLLYHQQQQERKQTPVIPSQSQSQSQAFEQQQTQQSTSTEQPFNQPQQYDLGGLKGAWFIYSSPTGLAVWYSYNQTQQNFDPPHLMCRIPQTDCSQRFFYPTTCGLPPYVCSYNFDERPKTIKQRKKKYRKRKCITRKWSSGDSESEEEKQNENKSYSNDAVNKLKGRPSKKRCRKRREHERQGKGNSPVAKKIKPSTDIGKDSFNNSQESLRGERNNQKKNETDTKQNKTEQQSKAEPKMLKRRKSNEEISKISHPVKKKANESKTPDTNYAVDSDSQNLSFKLVNFDSCENVPRRKRILEEIRSTESIISLNQITIGTCFSDESLGFRETSQEETTPFSFLSSDYSVYSTVHSREGSTVELSCERLLDESMANSIFFPISPKTSSSPSPNNLFPVREHKPWTLDIPSGETVFHPVHYPKFALNLHSSFSEPIASTFRRVSTMGSREPQFNKERTWFEILKDAIGQVSKIINTGVTSARCECFLDNFRSEKSLDFCPCDECQQKRNAITKKSADNQSSYEQDQIRSESFVENILDASSNSTLIDSCMLKEQENNCCCGHCHLECYEKLKNYTTDEISINNEKPSETL